MSASPLMGSVGATFEVVFGVFVVASLVLFVVTVRWAVRRDRQGRAEWLRRQAEAELAEAPAPSSSTNGHAPGRSGQRGGRPRPSR